eukprot:10394983-Lingulodinium_polyedra.AAC.1
MAMHGDGAYTRTPDSCGCTTNMCQVAACCAATCTRTSCAISCLQSRGNNTCPNITHARNARAHT